MELNKDVSPEISVHFKLVGGKAVVEADFDLAAFAIREGEQASPALKAILGVAAQIIKLLP